MTPSIVLVALLAPVTAAVLWARWHERARAVLGFKALAAALFLAAAFAAPAVDLRFARWIQVGLVAAAAGDLFLAGESRRALAAGVLSFLVAQACYAAAAWPIADVAPQGVPILGPLLLALGWTFWRGRARLGCLALPVVLYGLALTTATFLGASAWLALPGDAGRALLGVGMLLFFASDVAVARQRFVQPSFANRAWGLPCYYAAQGLLALSVGRVGVG